MKKILLSLILACFCTSWAGAQGVKSVSILGDSYSTFQGFVQPDTNVVWYFDPAKTFNTDVTSVRQTWWHQFIKNNGYHLCVNNSFSGATICNSGYKRGNPDFADYTDRSFVTRMTDLGCPDIIFIFGGTNDAWAGSPIGEYKYEGWTKEDLFSFRPAMAKMLAFMTDRYPNVDIYFILNDGLQEEINESVKTVCEHYQIPCIVLNGIDKANGHPTIKGMTQIYEQVESFLSR
jgi:lysophospholipase L1-like esterase